MPRPRTHGNPGMLSSNWLHPYKGPYSRVFFFFLKDNFLLHPRGIRDPLRGSTETLSANAPKPNASLPNSEQRNVPDVFLPLRCGMTSSNYLLEVAGSFKLLAGLRE